MINQLRTVTDAVLRKVGIKKPNPILRWDEVPEFCEIYKAIKSHTLVDSQRCYLLYQFIRNAMSLPGDIAEVGVYRGGTARLFAQLVAPTNKHLYLFDTFAGMPETDRNRDIHVKGDFQDTSLDSVQQFVGTNSHISFVPGLFPATGGIASDKEFCFVHIDVDIYRSVKDCCEYFYPRLVPGGVLIFDDYGFLSCPGARSAVDEFFADKPAAHVYLPTGQALAIRMPESQRSAS